MTRAFATNSDARERAGTSRENIIRMRVYVAGREKLDRIKSIIGDCSMPARPADTTFICGLATEEMRVEFEVTARIPEAAEWMTMPTIPVTGASRGFVRQLVSDGWEVMAACRDASGTGQVAGAEYLELGATGDQSRHVRRVGLAADGGPPASGFPLRREAGVEPTL